jgi:hypothetical protein
MLAPSQKHRKAGCIEEHMDIGMDRAYIFVCRYEERNEYMNLRYL